MIRVLVVSIQSNGGGAETVLKNLQTALAVTATPIALESVSKHAFDAGAKGGKLSSYLRFIRHVRALARHADFVVSGLEGIPYFLCMTATWGLRSRLVLWLHCSPISYVRFQTAKSRLAILGSIRFARRILCAAPLEAARLAKAGKRTLYLPNLRRATGGAAVAVERVLPILVFIGSLSPLKQPGKCIELLSRLPPVNTDGTAWRLDMFGAGPLVHALHGQAGAAGVAQASVFHGFVDDPWRDIAPGSILLLPSLTEAMPMVVLEAFERGCVVIANRFDGASFFDHHCGLFLLADFDDTEAALAAVAQACSWPAAELAQRALNSHRFLVEQFDSVKSLGLLHTYFAAELGKPERKQPC